MSDQDEYQSIPVAEARAAVQASGELAGFKGPEYWQGAQPGSFAPQWAPMFSPSDESPHPEFARVTITRKGQEPREVVVSWAEYADDLALNDPAWAEKRSQKPMTIFGAEVERHAYRVVFADVLAQIDRPTAPPARPGFCGRHPSGTDEPCAGCADIRRRRDDWESKGDSVRDWQADLAAASTKAEVDALFEEARAAKALKDAKLHEAFTRRLREVLASPKPAPAPAPSTAPSPAAVAQKAKPLTVQQPRRPQGDRPQGQRRRGKR